jgi:hypothetical protein
MRPPAKVHQRISSSANSMPPRWVHHLAHASPVLGQHGRGLVQVGEGARRSGRCAGSRWQTSKPRNCGRNPPQVGCFAARRRLDHHAAVVVLHAHDGPGAAAQQEAAHALDQAVDEALAERPERLPGAVCTV